MLRNSLVTALDLGHNAIGTEAGVVLAEVIKRSISLTSLNLEHNELGPRAGVPVLRALQENVSLTALDLASNAIGPKCTPLLSAVFSQNNASESVLRHADLSNNDLGADSFAAAVTLAHAVGSNRSLVYLKLDCNRLGRHAGVAFASALHTNRTLEVRLFALISHTDDAKTHIVLHPTCRYYRWPTTVLMQRSVLHFLGRWHKTRYE